MSSSARNGQPGLDTEDDSVSVGSEIRSELRTATAQGGNKNCLSCNLTETGNDVHNIEAGDALKVTVTDEAIVIQKANTGGSDSGSK